ncbi:MAG: DUF2059 domain-containing protein [Alphaproteobacteria bacterium]|nr:DUF2059 domain-containing protein [Alphaproteobacteria bacterium]
MKPLLMIAICFIAANSFAAPPQPKPGVVTQKKMREVALVLVDYMNANGALQTQMNRTIDDQINAIREIPCAESSTSTVRTILERTLSFDAMRPALANVYVNNFNLAELEWMVNFYQTSLGKKLLNVQPALYDTMSTISAGRIKDAEPEISAAIRTATNNVQCQQQLQRR